MKKIKKLFKFLPVVCLSLISCLSSVLFLDHDVKSTYAVDDSLPDSNLYTPYDVTQSSFYFDWSYITYNTSSNNSRNLHTRAYNGTPTDLTGLYFLFNETIMYSWNTGNGLNLSFYSYYVNTQGQNPNTPIFAHFKRIMINGTKIQYLLDNDVIVDVFDNNNSHNFIHDYSRSLFIVSAGNDDSDFSYYMNNVFDKGTFYHFYEFSTYISQVSTLQNQITSLNNQIDSLENNVSTLQGQVSTLQGQVSSLQTQLTNAWLNARRNTYIVNIHSVIDFEFQIYLNIDYQSSDDFYIKPNKMKIKSSIEVNDSTGSLIESHFNVIDTLDFSNLSSYYYSYNDLYTLLFIDVNDSWNLNVPYWADSDYSYFSLSNINNYINNWLLDFKSDLSVTGFDYSRTNFVSYNELLLGSLNGTNLAFNDGYSDGYDDGYEYGIDEGYSNGYSVGFSDGFSADSTATTIFSGILQVGMLPVNVLLAIFNFEILGINLSAFISAILTVCLTIIVIRTITGKKE